MNHDSIDTSEREAEEPRFINLPVREMREEPAPHQRASPLHAVLQLALEATPQQLPAALDALRGMLCAAAEPNHTERHLGMVPPPGWKLVPVEQMRDRFKGANYTPPLNSPRPPAPPGPPPVAHQRAPQSLTEWDLRGHLARSLKCWHRLTEEEADDLIKFARAHGIGEQP